MHSSWETVALMNCSLQIVSANSMDPTLLGDSKSKPLLSKYQGVQKIKLLYIYKIHNSKWTINVFFNYSQKPTLQLNSYYQKSQKNISPTAVVKGPFKKANHNFWREDRLWISKSPPATEEII